MGAVNAPDASRGDWSIETFTVSDSEAKTHNLRCLVNGRHDLVIEPGQYRRLMHAKRGVVMSTTPMEVGTHRQAYASAHGRVLVNGLGLGMYVQAILEKPSVTQVRVIELEPDVIALVAPHLPHPEKLEVIQDDAYTYTPGKGERFDYVWHDIWDDINPDNSPRITQLLRRYARRAEAQGAWSQDLLRRARYRPRF